MSNLRLFLILGILSVGYLLWQQWQIDYAPATEAAGQATDLQALDVPQDIPEDIPANQPQTDSQPAPDVPVDSVPSVATPDPAAAVTGQNDAAAAATIQIETDVLRLTVSTMGGNVIDALLLDYPVNLDEPDRVVRLFSDQSNRFYVAQSGLLSATHTSPDHRQIYSADRQRYVLGEGADELHVPLTWRGEDGIEVTQHLRLTRGSYAIEVSKEIRNLSDSAWIGANYRQLQRVIPPEPEKGNGFSNPERYSFMGAALYTPEDKYEKFDFEDIAEKAVSRDAPGGWSAMVQHYFISAWIPPAEESTNYSTAELRIPGQAPRYLVRAISPNQQVGPGETGSMSSILYVGPKLQDSLEDLAEGLTLTVDYGIFTPFSKILYWLLAHIHTLVGNWGWAIVLLTVLVKAVFFKLTEAQYKSMAKMRKLQPRILSLKERYGDDKQKFNVAMMEIYKKEKVNPLGGCLPLLIQIPVFIALYWVLLESVELRQASFVLWLNDLSSPDPYFILPIINGAAMFMTTKLSPNPAADPIQQKIMLAMPLVFSVMFAFFQSGLVLYWAVNSVLSLAQQWVITQRIEREG